MRLLPRSLRSQTLAVLAAALVVPHAIAIPLYSIDRGDVVASTEATDQAEHALAVVALLQKLPDEWRESLVRGLDSRAFRVSVDQEPTALPDQGDSGLASTVRAFISDQASSLVAPRALVSVHHADDTSDVDWAARLLSKVRELWSPSKSEAPTSRHLRMSFQLDDGSWLNIMGPISGGEAMWPRFAGVYILLVLAGVAVVVLWLVSRVTAPLGSFARAAETLGRDLRAEHLPERGPAEVVRAARAFNEMQDRLRRLVENRTQLLATISHDLRTPITLLRLRVELMENEKERERALNTLGDMEATIGAFLAFSRETFEEEPQRVVDIAALIGSICDDMVDAGARIEVEGPERLLCSCRKTALRRAIMNLVDNAIRYGERARVTWGDGGGEVRIAIEDNGPGIPADQLSKVFQPFYRFPEMHRDVSSGTGLGLSIAQAIIHQHGGRIVAENRPEGGLRVRVSLPK